MADLISNSSSVEKQIQRAPRMANFAHLGWAAFGAAWLVLLLILLTASSSGNESNIVLIEFNIAIGLSTLIIAAAWSVFGPGGYLKRLFWTHLFVAVVGFGYLAGLAATMPDNVWDDLSGLGLLQASCFLLGLAPISLAAQLPFWFFRAIFGWQLTLGNLPPAESFSLRDIFVFTFLAALSFAGPQIAANQVVIPDWYNAETSYEEVTHSDGTTTWEEVEITDQQVIDQRRREYKQQIREGILLGYFATAAWAFAISLLSFPAIPIIFNSKKISVGFGWMAVYIVAWCIPVCIFIGIVTSVFIGAAEFVFYFAFFMFAYGGMISTLLAMSRDKGFRLTSHRRYRKENSIPQFKEEPQENKSPFDD